MTKKTGLFFRMENADGSATELDAEESLAVASDASTAVDEVESATGAVTEVETGIDDAATAQTELADITADVGAAVDRGDGLTELENKQINARTERVAALLGSTASAEGLIFRKESFGNSVSRLIATKQRLEGLKEFGAKVWEAIKKGWAWLKDAVGNFFAKLTKNAGAIEKRLKDLQSRVAATNSSSKEKKDKLTASAKLFSIKGETSVATIETILTGAVQYVSLAKGVAQTIKPATGNATMNATSAKSQADSLLNILKAAGEIPSGELPKGTDKEAQAFCRLPGGQGILAVPLKQNVGTSEISLYKYEVASVDEKSATEYKAPSLAEMKTILDKGLAVIKTVQEFEKTRAEFETQCKANEAYCDAMIKVRAGEGAKKEGEADRTAAKEETDIAVMSIQAKLSIAKLVANKLPTAAFDAAAGAGDVVASALGNLKVEKETT